MAATVPTEEKINPLLDQALAIGEPAADTDQEPAPAEPELGQASNDNGSFERFMGSFGSPARWAGR